MNISVMNNNADNQRVVCESQDDTVNVRRVVLTPNRDPRLRRAQSTPRRNWNGEDDKSRTQISPWGRERRMESFFVSPVAGTTPARTVWGSTRGRSAWAVLVISLAFAVVQSPPLPTLTTTTTTMMTTTVERSR